MVSKRNNSIATSSEKNHSVVFTPSGLRGIVKSGVSVLDAARQLGVDLDSVCGGRGICTKCKVKPSFGEFTKFDIIAEENNLSVSSEMEEKSKEKNRIAINERLGCQAKIIGDIIIDIPEESQVHKQVIRKRIVITLQSILICKLKKNDEFIFGKNFFECFIKFSLNNFCNTTFCNS